MSFKRPQIHRKDGNEPELFEFAKVCGAVIQQRGPFDGWVYWRGKWTLVEVKLPRRKGHKNEYTPAQNALLAEYKDRGIAVWTWRTRDDVLRDFDRERIETLPDPNKWRVGHA